MAFDFTGIIAAETKKQEETTRSQSGSNGGYKTLYPFANGRLEFRLIGNEVSGLLYRELVFHEYSSDGKKQTVPCLSNMYGGDCPICNAVSNVQNTFDDKDVFKKHGFKRRGIMFAKLLNYTPENYFGDNNNAPKPGDIVLFMFPKAVINELRNLIVEYQDELENLFASNTGRTVTLKIGTQANGFPEYSFFVKGTNASICVKDDGTPDDETYKTFITSMPNINDMKYPSTPTDDIMRIHKLVSEKINNDYFGQVSSNTIPNITPMQTPPSNDLVNRATPSQSNLNVSTESKADDSIINQSNSTDKIAENLDTMTKGQRKPCFGNNKYEGECLTCPFEAECI